MKENITYLPTFITIGEDTYIKVAVAKPEYSSIDMSFNSYKMPIGDWDYDRYVKLGECAQATALKRPKDISEVRQRLLIKGHAIELVVYHFIDGVMEIIMYNYGEDDDLTPDYRIDNYPINNSAIDKNAGLIIRDYLEENRIELFI